MNLNIPDLRAAIERAFPKIKINDEFSPDPVQQMIDRILKEVLDVLQEKPVRSGGAYEDLAE